MAVRFPRTLDGTGKEGGFFFCSDRNYDLSSLHQKARNQVRRGLENCVIERIDFTDLAKCGHILNTETFLRQHRNPRTIAEQQWYRYCEAASAIPGFEAWGAYVHNHLAAFIVMGLIEDVETILHQSAATDYLGYYPTNALVFSVTGIKLSCPKVTSVSYGLKSIDDTTGLNHFKLRMGFMLKPFKEHIVFNPLLKLFLFFGGRKAVEWMCLRYPESDLWRKASKVCTW